MSCCFLFQSFKTLVRCFSYFDLSVRTSIRNLLSFLHFAANGQAGNPICLFIGSKTVLDQLITSFFISSAFFLRDKCLHNLRFGTRVSRCSFPAVLSGTGINSACGAGVVLICGMSTCCEGLLSGGGVSVNTAFPRASVVR